MQVNIKEFLNETGLPEQMYPGKRVVSKLAQPGENKSHCVVYDWRTEILRIDVKAGLSGKDLSRKDLTKYPVSFQAPTYVEINTSIAQPAESALQENTEDEITEDETGEGEEEGSGGSGSGSGGKKIGAKKTTIFGAFSTVVEGRIPGIGDVKKLVVMGKEIAREAFGPVLKALAAQIKSLTVTPVNILANAMKVTVASPGGRAQNELPQGLVERADVKYKPKDMFGVNPT